MVEPRTIDNLGIEASVRFATDKAGFDEAYVKESAFIKAQTSTAITAPFYKSEATALFDMQTRNSPDGEFAPPEGFGDRPNTLFTYSLIPALGSEDKMEAIREKVAAHTEAQATEARSKESKQLEKLFDTIEKLNRDFLEIANKRNQYSKG